MNKNIWLDLELRKDIDDYITLIFALENKINITEISINNPSKNELCLLKSTLKEYNVNIPIIYSGEITEHEEDLHESLMDQVDLNFMNNVFYCDLKTYKKHVDIKDRTIFCGGSLTTLSEIIKEEDINIEAYIQGGYAAESIIGAKNVLKKFKKREKVPTWNLNLDIEASDNVMNSKNVNCHFISKNVCHASFIGLSDLTDEKSKINKVLKKYFNGSERKKCMHDLLAFMTIFNKDVVQFKKIDLKRTNDERCKWFSELNPESNKKISVSFDYNLFLDLALNKKSLKIENKSKISQKNK